MDQKTGESIMAMVLKTIHDNVIAGVRDAQAAGRCEFPTVIEVDLALDANGLPCSAKVESAARIEVTIDVCPS